MVRYPITHLSILPSAGINTWQLVERISYQYLRKIPNINKKKYQCLTSADFISKLTYWTNVLNWCWLTTISNHNTSRKHFAWILSAKLVSFPSIVQNKICVTSHNRFLQFQISIMVFFLSFFLFQHAHIFFLQGIPYHFFLFTACVRSLLNKMIKAKNKRKTIIWV